MDNMSSNTNTTQQHLIEDPFGGIYSNQWFNWGLFATYLLGQVGCAGLAIVSWFERSGQAGPFRTLVNQLASFHNELTIIAYFGFGIMNLRAILGPMPFWICRLAQVLRPFTFVCMAINNLLITATKFSFIFIFKSIPSIEDNFLSLMLRCCMCLFSTLAVVVMLMHNQKTLIPEAICENVLPSEDGRFFPFIALILGLCIIGEFIISIPVAFAKKTSLPSNNNRSNEESVNLASLYLTWIFKINTLLLIASYMTLTRTQPQDLNEFPNNWLVYISYTFGPFIYVMSQWSMYLLTQKSLRRATKRLFISQRIQPVVE